MEALSEPVNEIIEEICNVLEQTPPELSGDIADNGIILAGGGSMLYGFDKLISSTLGIRVTVPDDPIAVVAKGTGKLLSKTELLA